MIQPQFKTTDPSGDGGDWTSCSVVLHRMLMWVPTSVGCVRATVTALLQNTNQPTQTGEIASNRDYDNVTIILVLLLCCSE